MLGDEPKDGEHQGDSDQACSLSLYDETRERLRSRFLSSGTCLTWHVSQGPVFHKPLFFFE